MSGNNVTLLSDFSAQGERSGWKNAEEELLWQEVRKAREEGNGFPPPANSRQLMAR